MQHSSLTEAKKLKVKTPFYMQSSPAARISRYICKDISKIQHYARLPSDPINYVDLKAECELDVIQVQG